MKYLILILGLIFAAPIWAADGDGCTGPYKAPAGGTCRMVMDGATTGNRTSNPRTPIPRAYERLWIEVADEDSCSAYTVTVSTSSQATGGVLHEIGTMSFGGTTMLQLDGFGAHPLAYVEATSSGVTACSNLDVLIHSK